MRARLPYLAALVLALSSLGATYRTTNFVVQAPTQELAQTFGQWAEHYRREKAVEWLGQEMPTWPQPCPLQITISSEGPSGATSFNFGAGRVMGQRMEIQGPTERLLKSVLPHEITHTVFAHYFRQPVPRWADEGGSVLSEDDIERVRHDQLVRSILNQGRQIPARRLWMLKEYPRDVMCLYAQGYSMSNYLVNRSDKRTFLQFVHAGLHQGWDQAAWAFYKHRTVEELEEAWLKHLRDTKGQPHMQLARGKQVEAQPVTQTAAATVNPTTGTVVRLTVPLELMSQPAPVARGQSPSEKEYGQRYNQAPVTPVSRPGYLPEFQGQPTRATPPAPRQPMPGWQPQSRQEFPQGMSQGSTPPAPQPPAPYNPVQVQLGPPQFGPGVGEDQIPVGSRSPVGLPQ